MKRQAAGYIPFKLLKKYEAKSKVVGVIECLSAMAVNGEESSLFEYTRKWIHLVNRGGLFEVNDTVYNFFREIEIQVRKQLITALDLNVSDEDVRKAIIDCIGSDEDVQFSWGHFISRH